MRKLPGWYWTVLLSLFSLAFGLFLPNYLDTAQSDDGATPTEEVVALASNTPTPFIVAQSGSNQQQVNPTATNTLLPPPTLEAPTSTPLPSATPTVTPTQSILVDANVDGIQGLPPSESSELVYVCEPTKEWSLEYTIQANETLSSIAAKFNTYAETLSQANCIDDPNLVRLGQVILVPGESLPDVTAIVCESYELLQPLNGIWDIPATGQLVFNWDGTEAPINLLRLYPPDFDFSNPDSDAWIDYTFPLRQNYSLDLTDIADEGRWQWQVFPLDSNFV